MTPNSSGHPSDTGHDNPGAARLEACLSILMDAAATGDDAELEKARRQVQQIASMSDEDVLALAGGEDVSQAPVQHSRGDFLDVLQYEAPRIPAATFEGRHGGQWIEARELAGLYASLYTSMEEAGKGPPATEVAQAREELEPHGWTVKYHSGAWYAVDIEGDDGGGEEEAEDAEDEDEDEDEEDTGPAQHKRVKLDSPEEKWRAQDKSGRWYALDHVPRHAQPGGGAKRPKKPGVTSEAAKEVRRARGLDRETLKNRLAGHAEPELNAHGKRRAAASLRLLQRHHGELALHRVEELVDLAEGSLERLKTAGGANWKARATETKLRQTLARLHHMMGLAEKWDTPGEQPEATSEQPSSPDVSAVAPAATAGADEPGFTGIDRLGRRWVDGKLVAKPEEPPSPGGAAAAPPEEPRSPHLKLADSVADHLRSGRPITKEDLHRLARLAYGGSMAEGKYGYSEATDALEAGFNKALRGQTDPTADLADAAGQARQIASRVSQLPTQTNRSGEKETHQQFSTPPHYAFAAAWLANLGPDDTVLEPSAGTGCLAVQAENAGADVYANELSRRRAEFLRDLFGDDHVHVENAEQIAGILPRRGVPAPTAIIMNPPFSQTAGRLGDKMELMTGARHVEEALRLLAPGGRLVAIVGGGRDLEDERGGMSPASPTFRDWFARMAAKYDLRANVGVSGKEYGKYGTAFNTRVLVFDKTGPQDGAPVTGAVETIPDLMALLEGVRNDRPQASRQSPGKPVGPGVPAETGAGTVPGGDAAGATGGDLAGQPGAGGPLGGAELPGGREGAGEETGPGGGPGAGGGDAGGELRGTASGPGGAAGAGVAGPQGSPGQPAAGIAPGKKRGRGGKGAGGKPVQQPSAGLPRFRPASPVKIEAVEPEAGPVDRPVGPQDEQGPQEESSQADLGPSLYEAYRPQLLRVAGAQQHKTPLVESAAMSAVRPPTPNYSPVLSPDIVEHGILSEAQLEALVYTGQAHSAFLPESGASVRDGDVVLSPSGEGQTLGKTADGRWTLSGTSHSFGAVEEAQQWLATHDYTTNQKMPIPHTAAYRRGYFIGDGTGVGKGREIAGIIADNWNQGRHRHVWISQKQTLQQDAHRDFKALGLATAEDHKKDQRLVNFDKIRKGQAPGEGVAFVTYDTLKGAPKDKTAKTNIEQLAEWLGPDFDGVIAFDESHGLANAMSTKKGRGEVDASQRAVAGIKLQQMCPKARVVYVSATGATEVANLAYAERLGLWGKGTPFASKVEFVNEMNKGGVAAMEAVAQSLKAMGGYTARSLSFDDGTESGKVTYERLTHQLTDDQRGMYDAAADGWQTVLQNIDKALESTHGGKQGGSKNARSAALSQFWGAQQRFFNQVMTAMQTPSVIKAMERDIAEGRAPVVQIVNTMEAATKRALASREEDQAIEDMDVSPKEVLMQYLQNSFPVHRMEERQNAQTGQMEWVVAKDSSGVPIEDPEAVAIREEMLAMVGMMRIPESPLDMIINHFGHEHVAEATGRTTRIVSKEHEGGARRKVVERRDTNTANAAEASAFQSGKKKLLIFSDAGGTGRSYHADRDAENQKQRVHYMLQPGWRADNAVQGLGRTHRTNQAQAPTYRLVEIEELKAQKRFISTIARRLDQLGALTKGQRQAGGGGLFSAADNLESPQAREAMESLFNDLARGRVPGLDRDEVVKQLGLKSPDEEKKGRRQQQPKPAMPDSMGQFLNRLLSLRVDTQAAVFDAFDQRLRQKVEQAVREGTLDTGVENFPAHSVTRNSDTVVYKDQATGAEVRHVVTTAKKQADKMSFDRLSKGNEDVGFFKNKQSGRVYKAYKTADKTDPETGKVTQQYRLVGPTSVSFRPTTEFNGYYGRFDQLGQDEAKQLWDVEHAEAPDFTEHEEHFLTGAILPVWDRIPGGDKPKIYRLKTDDGQTMVGRHVPRRAVPQMMKNMGIQAEAGARHSPADVHAKLSSGRFTATLSNGWQLKPVRVQNERRIEIKGVNPYAQGAVDELKRAGAIVERVGYDTRFFIPIGPAGANVLRDLTEGSNRLITDVDEPEQHGRRAAPAAQMARGSASRPSAYSRLLSAARAATDPWTRQSLLRHARSLHGQA